jgi:hypothetical protein
MLLMSLTVSSGESYPSSRARAGLTSMNLPSKVEWNIPRVALRKRL